MVNIIRCNIDHRLVITLAVIPENKPINVFLKFLWQLPAIFAQLRKDLMPYGGKTLGEVLMDSK